VPSKVADQPDEMGQVGLATHWPVAGSGDKPAAHDPKTEFVQVVPEGEGSPELQI